MGKRKSMTWDHFDSLMKNGIEYGKCKYCPASFRKNATRMTQHLLYKCEGITENAKQEMEDNFPHVSKRDYKMEYDWPGAVNDVSVSGDDGEHGEDLCTNNARVRGFDIDRSCGGDLPSTSSLPAAKRQRHSSSSSASVCSSPHYGSAKPRYGRSPVKASAARAAIQSFTRKLTPMLDRVIVQKADAVTKTRGGIVIPEKAQGKVLEGTIIAVGPGARNDRGEHVPVGVVVGDTVILPEYGGTKVEIDEKELFIYREHDILAKVNKE